MKAGSCTVTDHTDHACAHQRRTAERREGEDTEDAPGTVAGLTSLHGVVELLLHGCTVRAVRVDSRSSRNAAPCLRCSARVMVDDRRLHRRRTDGRLDSRHCFGPLKTQRGVSDVLGTTFAPHRRLSQPWRQRSPNPNR
jgi:hypothetical protein